jgi:hypothetical protein
MKPLGLTTELYESVACKTCSLCGLFLSALTDDDEMRMGKREVEYEATCQGLQRYWAIVFLYVDDKPKERTLALYHSPPDDAIVRYVSLMKPEGCKSRSQMALLLNAFPADAPYSLQHRFLAGSTGSSLSLETTMP